MAIKNTDFVKAIGGFGEGFIKTLQYERERKQKELEFNQKMAFETRQMNLANQIAMDRNRLYEQQFGLDKEKFESDERSGYQEIPMMPNAPLFPIMQGGVMGGEKNKEYNGVVSPFREDKFYAPRTEQVKSNLEGSYENPETGTVWKYDETNRIGIDTGIPYDKSKGKTTVNVTTPQAPYTPTRDLEQDWNTYSELDKLDKNWKDTPQEKRNIINDKGEVITYSSYEELKKAKDKLYSNIKIESDDRAKKINEEYVGFNSIYRDLMRDPNFKKAVKEGRGDVELFRAMQGFPEEAINEMKNLIYKRIF